MIKNILNRINSFSVEEKQQFFLQERKNLTQYMPELIQILQSNNKSLWSIAIQTIAIIGYPHNEPAIPVLVEHLCDGNWPGWEDGVECLATISPSVVVPFLIGIFLDGGRERIYWKDDVEEFCLALPKMGKEFMALCLPSLLYIFYQKDALALFDIERLFFAINELDLEHLSYFIPIILRIIQESPYDHIVNDAQILLKKFPERTTILYQYVRKNDDKNFIKE